MPAATRLASLLATVTLVVACAPLAQSVYVPRAEGGVVEYSPCAFNSQVPIGLRLNGAGIQAHIKLAEHEGRRYVELRLEVPQGTTVQLLAPRLSIRSGQPSASFIAEFPTASLVDTPIVNASSPVAAVQSLQLAPTAPLVGGLVQAGRHSANRSFWFASYLPPGAAEELVVELPAMTVNKVAHTFAPIHFTRESRVVVALINC
jgi:hypothetical protein